MHLLAVIMLFHVLLIILILFSRKKKQKKNRTCRQMQVHLSSSCESLMLDRLSNSSEYTFLIPVASPFSLNLERLYEEIPKLHTLHISISMIVLQRNSARYASKRTALHVGII